MGSFAGKHDQNVDAALSRASRPDSSSAAREGRNPIHHPPLTQSSREASDHSSGVAGGSAERPLSREAPRLPYDIPQAAVVRPSRPVLQAKLAVSSPGDEDEQEADRVAERVMRMPQPATRQGADDDNILNRKSSAGGAARTTEQPPVVARKETGGTAARSNIPAPAIVQDALRSPGAPLDAPVRTFFEPRFGRDLGQVRVHIGDRAAKSADAVHARAYTSGHDIVFGRGEYAPSTTDGSWLLAHELTHVEQQAASTSAAIQRDTRKDAPPDPKLAKLAPPVKQAIADADADMAKQLKEKQYPIFVHAPMNYKGLKALLPLAEAIDDERTADIPKLTDAFIQAESVYPFRALGQDMLVEMSARLFTLGLQAESDKLRDMYSAHVKQFEILSEDWGKSRRDINIYKATVDRTITMADSTSAQKSQASLELMIRALDMLRDAILAVDQEALRFESLGPSPHFSPTSMSRTEYWNALIAVLTTLITGMEMHLQLLLERAATDLGEGRGSATLLILRDLVENKLSPAIRSGDGKKNIGGITVKITTTEIKAGQGTIRDSLSKDPKSRSVAVSTYTPGQDYVHELESNLSRLVGARIDQIATLARIYGATDVLRADKPAEKEKSADAARNAETMKKFIAQGGKLRLDNDTDWSQFVLQKYKDMTGPGAKDKAQALSAVIDLLFDYLQAFTVHARFTNIYDQADFKDAYFDKPFPRTLAGQLVQDCGVYAMRVAYILSLVRQELGLRFRFIRLPVHVGLIITGDGLPIFLVHNDHFKEYSWEDLQRFYEIWKTPLDPDAAPKTGAKAPPPKPPLSPIDDEQFLGEFSALHDIEGPVDMPFRVSDVPKTAKTAPATKQALWAEYQKVSSRDVFGPSASNKSSPGYLFHNRYLALTEMFREWHNDTVVPFWNEKCPFNWAIIEVILKFNGRTEIAGSALQPILEAHLKQLDEDLKPVNARMERIKDEERSMSRQLREDPQLPAKGVRITHVSRLSMVHDWESYRQRVEAVIADAKAHPDQKFTVASVINTDLQPPFIPMPEKALSIQF